MAMQTEKIKLLNHKLSDLKVNMLFAKLSVCPPDWIQTDFIPEYNKFYYICDGEGQITVDGKRFQPLPGQLFFAPAGVHQSFSVTSGPPYTMYWCHFTSNIGFHQLFQSFGLPNVITVGDSSKVISHFEQMSVNRKKIGPATSIKTKSVLFELCAYFFDHAVMDTHDSGSSLSLNKLLGAIQYMDNHLSNEITIQDLSQITHFHPNYFIRFFKAHLGMPPMRFLYERRLEKAKEWLVCRDLSINDVAHMVGFNDAAHFSSSFKKHTGVSPSEYRHSYDASDRISRL